MRSVGVRFALNAVAAGAVVAMAAFGGASAVAADDAPAQNASAEPAKNAEPDRDYYTRRARAIIDAEKYATSAPHPLAAGYPGMDVTVCEAGCQDRGQHVVYTRPERAAETTVGEFVPSSTSSEPLSPQTVTCVAGCYDASSSDAIPEPEPTPTPAAWDTTTTRAAPATRVRDPLSPIR